jgi:phosphate transport system permease protein
MALPYHLYVISTSGTDIENQERWLGTALVLIIIVIQLIGECTRKYYGKVK